MFEDPLPLDYPISLRGKRTKMVKGERLQIKTNPHITGNLSPRRDQRYYRFFKIVNRVTLAPKNRGLRYKSKLADLVRDNIN
jgi:hypothetical protein